MKLSTTNDGARGFHDREIRWCRRIIGIPVLNENLRKKNANKNVKDSTSRPESVPGPHTLTRDLLLPFRAKSNGVTQNLSYPSHTHFGFLKKKKKNRNPPIVCSHPLPLYINCKTTKTTRKKANFFFLLCVSLFSLLIVDSSHIALLPCSP